MERKPIRKRFRNIDSEGAVFPKTQDISKKLEEEDLAEEDIYKIVNFSGETPKLFVLFRFR